MLDDVKPPPAGEYGVWCVPKGHINDPRWLDHKPLTYEAACAEADRMNRTNLQWHYYAYPIVCSNPGVPGEMKCQ